MRRLHRKLRLSAGDEWTLLAAMMEFSCVISVVRKVANLLDLVLVARVCAWTVVS